MTTSARRFVVKEQTFGFTVEFYCGTPQQAAIRRCARVMEMDANDPENAPDENAAAWAFSDRHWSLIWMEHTYDWGSLVHELYHVTQDFVKHIESQDDEVGAYLIQFFFNQALRRLSSNFGAAGK